MDSNLNDKGIPCDHTDTKMERDSSSSACESAMQFLSLVYTPEALRSAASGRHPLRLPRRE